MYIFFLLAQVLYVLSESETLMHVEYNPHIISSLLLQATRLAQRGFGS